MSRPSATRQEAIHSTASPSQPDPSRKSRFSVVRGPGTQAAPHRVALLLVSEGGIIHGCNAETAALFDLPETDVLGGHFADRVASPDRARITQFLETAAETGDLCCEMVLRNRQGEEIPFRCTICRLTNTERAGAQLSLILQEKPGPCGAPLHEADPAHQREFPLALMVLDEARRVLSWNEEAEGLLGWRASEVLGTALALHPPGHPHGDEIARLLSASRPFRCDAEVTTRSGVVKRVAIVSSPIQIPDQRLEGHVLLLRDRAESSVPEALLLEAIEREARRIGEDLDERLCQQLLGAAWSAHALSRDLRKADREAATKVHALADFIHEAVAETQALARRLNPVAPDAEGLMSGLRKLAEETSRIIPCTFFCPEPVLIPDSPSALHAYRLTQQAFLLAIQTARATRLAMRLTAPQGRIHLDVLFDAKEPMIPPDRFLAVRTMQYRARAVGGFLSMGPLGPDEFRIALTFPSRP